MRGGPAWFFKPKPSGRRAGMRPDVIKTAIFVVGASGTFSRSSKQMNTGQPIACPGVCVEKILPAGGFMRMLEDFRQPADGSRRYALRQIIKGEHLFIGDLG